ncbi:uncharacterized protein LOC106168312 [Lingula anatina]|uniref:Uncharacterized protein LOC106168312 n=1 Tax=Lingula anatina TaxID=7574 RepID=A0A1S3IZ14_LINAN|nr:uncharacterized protein LOC106168312 [Lingula anatina]|eukprot:XP_013402789.1 uncharacterized protein LOC106168312 [Lingula anatina]
MMKKKGKIAGWMSEGQSEVRRETEQLCNDLEATQQDYKKFRLLVEQLHREYVESKELDFFRRYRQLKSMIKRTVTHLRLSNGGDALSSGLKQMCRDFVRQKDTSAAAQRIEERYKDLSDDALLEQNVEIQEQITDTKRKTDIIKDLIHEMEVQYEESKRYIAIQRYRLMKGMIKEVINSRFL